MNLSTIQPNRKIKTNLFHRITKALSTLIQKPKVFEPVFTVIIPTMWVSDYIHQMLGLYESEQLVKEVIVIDNAPSRHNRLDQYQKVRVLTKGKNIFVNPAWNWGVRESKTKFIVIANDDILMAANSLRTLLCKARTLGKDQMLGLGKDCFSRKPARFIKIKAIDKKSTSYGTFMVMRKASYVPIPEDLLIWRGDVIQWERNEHLQIIGLKVRTRCSATIKQQELWATAKQDFVRAKKYDFQKLPKIT
jgi:hypothetical protein